MFESTKVHPVKRMWNGGPLRQFSEIRGASGWTPYDGGGYAGSYICDGCKEAVVGVYRAKDGLWYCAGCTGTRKTIPPIAAA